MSRTINVLSTIMKLLCGKKTNNKSLCCWYKTKNKKIQSFINEIKDIKDTEVIHIKTNYKTNKGFEFIEDSYVLKWNFYTYGLINKSLIAVSIPIYDNFGNLIINEFLCIPKNICN